MKISGPEPAIGRRTFLTAMAALLGGAWIAANRKHPMAKVAPFVKPKERWAANDFYDFLQVLPPAAMLRLKTSIGLLPDDADETRLKGPGQDALDIQKHALWVSSNIFEYWLREPTELDYHNLVKWASEEAGVEASVLRAAPTFALERQLLTLLFAEMWDKLAPEHREEVLVKIDRNGSITDKAATALLTGAGAIAVLNSTVAFAGFAFYTTMSVTIAAAASAVGVTLPFATYLGASTVVGILTGPVGWAIIGVSALGGLVLAGRANVQKSVQLIACLHALKVEALLAAGVREEDVFGGRLTVEGSSELGFDGDDDR